MGYNEIFTIILCTLGGLLLLVLIILCLKFMYSVDKLNIILTDVEKKLKSVDGVFNAIDSVSDAVTTVSDALVSKLLLLIGNIFKKKGKDDKDE